MDIERWDLAPSLCDERRRALANPPTFQAIIEAIQEKMEVLCCHPNEFSYDNRFSRVVYCFRVSAPLFDMFFNSKNGYRASYYRSPYDGLRDNGLFIRSVLPALLASAETRCIAPKELGFAEKSLKSCSSKAWLAERGKELCGRCAGEWSPPQDETAEILNNRWENGDSVYAKWGRKAPYLTKIRIFGAFLSERHDELIPASKRHRAREIHEVGWS